MDVKSYSALLSLFASVLVILSAGFPLTFSLYAGSLQNILGYSQVQVNSVNVANIIGQFLCYPLIGLLSDKYGANRVCLFSALLGIPGLLLAANAYERRQGYLVLCSAFFLIGVASTCAYITSVSTCARNFAGARGLAIAIPICAYGFATLLYTLVFERYFSLANQAQEQYNIPGFWRNLCWFVGLAALLGSCFMKSPTSATNESISGPLEDSSQEQVPLLGSQEESRPPFFEDITVLMYAVAYIFAAGATETLVGNMGSIVESILLKTPDANGTSGSYASRAVSVFAIFSTVSRLIVGLLGDVLAKKGYSRIPLLLGLTALMSLAMLTLALAPPSTTIFFLVAGINGFCYGSLYCIGPTLASVIWGLRDFGRNWGCLAYSPLIGSVLGSYLYAALYDRRARAQHPDSNQGHLCAGQGCYSLSFLLMASAVALAMSIWVLTWRIWRRRGIIV
ncbi:major facilitator superfamily domain-containing protein [Protomyces lactucae-debilis]|uniref:Probable transporter MCH1 n=1 Tax=Protomyces lactucae-debilis TaxID=2754530 RepID=A0A1Y2FC14_PROLT|nr:major facilitator superfamily domain-containing protein [Protomyces lactucae-debilis]ORY81453.1 major facilitator superfamily domain-containing protein [Protomyces lactucae-debilis]